jgi:hypothetical protein
MSDVRRVGRAKGVAIYLALSFVVIKYSQILLRVWLARASKGLGPAAALRDAISGGWDITAAMMVGAVVGAAALFLINRPVAGEGISPETAGLRQWRRMRLLVTIGALPLILLTAGWVGFIMLTGKDLDVHVLMMLGLAVSCAVVVMVYWIVKPSREYLYAQGTGDRSRIDDERAQEVKGRAADTTINVFMGVMFLVGVPYEVIIQGVLPFRSYAEMAVICLVWGLASWRWKRKL